MSKSNNKIQVSLEIDGKQATVTLNNADSALKSIIKHSSSATTTFSKIGNIVTGINSAMMIGQRAFGVISEGLQKYTEFESGLKNVNTIIGVGNDELKKYGEQLLDISKTTGTASKELTDAFYQAASAGIPAGQAIQFIETAAKAARAGLTDTTTAVDGMTTVLNAFHLSANDAGKVADVMFQTVKLGKTTFGELAANLSTVAPLAASSGVKFEEISAAIASLTKQGVPTAQAMTQIRSSIVAANDVLGDGWSKTMTYQEAMQAISDKAGGSQVELKNLVGRVEAVSAVLAVTGKNAATAADDLNAMTSAVGAMGEAFKENTDTIEFKMQRLQSTFDTMVISIVENLGPSLSWLMENFAGGLDIIFGKENSISGAAERTAGFIESLKGTTQEWRDSELEILKYQWDELDAAIQKGDLSSEELEQAKITLKVYEDQAAAISGFKENIKETVEALSQIVAAPKLTIPVEYSLPTNATDLEDIDAIVDEEEQKYWEKLDEFNLLKQQYHDEELLRIEELKAEKEASAASELDLIDMLSQSEEQYKNLTTQLNNARTKEEFDSLKKEQQSTLKRIQLIKQEQEARRQMTEQFAINAFNQANTQESLGKQILSSIRGLIKGYIAEGVAKYAASAFEVIPFPFGAIAAVAASTIASSIFNSVIPAFAAGVTNFDGGLALVGERGPELVNLPRGSDVIPAYESAQIMNSGGNNSAIVQGLNNVVAAVNNQTARLEAVERIISISEFDEKYQNYLETKNRIGS